MATSTPSTGSSDDESNKQESPGAANENIDLRAAAAAYEEEQRLQRLVSDIERYDPELLDILGSISNREESTEALHARVSDWSRGYETKK